MSASGEPLEPITVVAVANPAAGADWTYTLTAPGELVAIRSRLSTSAVVANRQPILSILDGAGHVLFSASLAGAQTAGTGTIYSYGNGITFNGTAAGIANAGIPNLVLPAGAIVQMVTTSLDVGDQWSQIVLTFANR